MGYYIDPQQELFTALKLGLEARGYAVYDGFLPPEGTPYPFVYLGEMPQSDTEHKNGITGQVLPYIHVWHDNPRERGTVSQMLADAKMLCRQIEDTGHYKWIWSGINSRIIPDTTTKTPLLHGIMEAVAKFS